MVIADQHLPFFLAARNAVNGNFASVFEPNARTSAPKHIGPGVDRVGQQPMNRVIACRAPLHDAPLGAIDANRKVDLLLPQP